MHWPSFLWVQSKISIIYYPWLYRKFVLDNNFLPVTHFCEGFAPILLITPPVRRWSTLRRKAFCRFHCIYDKRDDFNFHITNFPFLSSNIPSSPAYGVLSLNLYDTPGLAPRMNILYWGPGDFPVSYSNRDTSRNAWNRHSGSFMVDMGILFSNMKYPSHEC